MSIKPILFSSEMVQAILAGRKTQTRRICQPYPWAKPCKGDYDHYDHIEGGNVLDSDGYDEYLKDLDLYNKSRKPKYHVNDILWVRETWANSLIANEYCYKADTDNPIYLDVNWKWKPSIHMPKEAARIFLKVTDVRVEKLQDISGKDAIAEGVESRLPDCGIAQSQFQELWQSIHGSDSWHSNPYVWVYSFEKVDRPVNFLEV